MAAPGTNLFAAKLGKRRFHGCPHLRSPTAKSHDDQQRHPRVAEIENQSDQELLGTVCRVVDMVTGQWVVLGRLKREAGASEDESHITRRDAPTLIDEDLFFLRSAHLWRRRRKISARRRATGDSPDQHGNLFPSEGSASTSYFQSGTTTRARCLASHVL